MDFTDFSQDGKGAQPKAVKETSVKWWLFKGVACADSISTALTIIDQAQQARLVQIVASARLYGNTPLLGMTGQVSARFNAISALMKERLHYNATQSVVDTAIARLTRDKPTPYHLTSGGDYHTQRKAKKMNELRDGIFYECQTYKKGEMVSRDAAIWGMGMLKVFARDGKICHERVPCSQIWIDEMEAMTADPRSMHQVMNVDRDMIQAWLGGGKNTSLIEDANRADLQSNIQSVADVVQLRESWHLRSGPDAKDGRHVISIAGYALLEEKWEHDFFPFAVMPWCPKSYGYWPQGLVEQLQPMQLELNKLMRGLQISYDRACLMLWMIENGSKIVKSHLDNEIGRIINYTGTPPTCETPPIAPPEIYQQIETIIRRMRDQAGLSEMATQGEKPAGVDSGKALRTLDDMETVRFTQISHAYEQLYMDADKISLAVARDIAEEDGDYSVKVPGRNSQKERKWTDVDLAPDDYSIHCYPTSSLPDDPAGRLETVQEYMQAGIIPPEVGQDLLEFPDLKRFETLNNAMTDRLHEVLDNIVDEGEYEPPEPYFDLEAADKLALQYLVLGESQGLEPERCEMLRRWRSQVAALESMAAQALQPPMGAGMPGGPQVAGRPGGPQAAPEPPPQSQLLPNAPGAQA